jgi:hypothetical protein
VKLNYANTRFSFNRPAKFTEHLTPVRRTENRSSKTKGWTPEDIAY